MSMDTALKFFSKLRLRMISWWPIWLKYMHVNGNLAQIHACTVSQVREYYFNYWHTTSSSILQQNKLARASRSSMSAGAHDIDLQPFQFRPAAHHLAGDQENQSLPWQAMQMQVHVLVYHCTRIIRIATCFYHCITAAICGSYLWTRPSVFYHEWI